MAASISLMISLKLKSSPVPIGRSKDFSGRRGLALPTLDKVRRPYRFAAEPTAGSDNADRRPAEEQICARRPHLDDWRRWAVARFSGNFVHLVDGRAATAADRRAAAGDESVP